MTKVLRFAVSALLIVWLGSNTDWTQVGQAFLSMRTEYWILAVGLLALSQVVSAVRWRLMARALGMSSPLSHMTGFYFIGMFFNLFLPTSVGGDVVRAWYLQGRTGKRLASFVSVLVDRVNGLMVLLLMASAGAAVCPLDLPRWIPLMVWGSTVAGFVSLAALPWLARWGPQGSQRVEKVRAMLSVLRTPGLLAKTSLLSLAVQVANVVVVWLVGLAIHVQIPASYYWILVPMVSILTLLPISLNGVGVREGATALFLAPLGVGQSAALTLSFLWFAVHASNSLLGGLVYLVGNFPKPESAGASDHGPVDRHSHQGRTGQYQQAA